MKAVQTDDDACCQCWLDALRKRAIRKLSCLARHHSSRKADPSTKMAFEMSFEPRKTKNSFDENEVRQCLGIEKLSFWRPRVAPLSGLLLHKIVHHKSYSEATSGSFIQNLLHDDLHAWRWLQLVTSPALVAILSSSRETCSFSSWPTWLP